MRAAAVLLAAAALAAQQEPKLSTTVRVVIAPATVTDRRTGRYVPGLAADDFIIDDGGRRRRADVDVTYFPISLVIAVETSTLSEATLAKASRIGPLIEALVVGKAGEAAVVSFAGDVNTVLPFTSNASDISGARSAGSTSLAMVHRSAMPLPRPCACSLHGLRRAAACPS